MQKRRGQKLARRSSCFLKKLAKFAKHSVFYFFSESHFQAQRHADFFVWGTDFLFWQIKQLLIQVWREAFSFALLFEVGLSFLLRIFFLGILHVFESIQQGGENILFLLEKIFYLSRLGILKVSCWSFAVFLNWFLLLAKIFHNRYFQVFLVFFVSLQILFASLFYFAYEKTILSFKVAPSFVAQAELRGQLPKQIQIPSLSIDLSLQGTLVKNGLWEISEKSASYLLSSARPKEGSNIVIYAHNTKHLFARLPEIQVGQEILLLDAEGKTAKYIVSETKRVLPNAVEEVLPTDHEVVTVYTCTGFLDSQRFVVKALPSESNIAAQ